MESGWEGPAACAGCGKVEGCSASPLVESKHSWWPRGPILTRAKEHS